MRLPVREAARSLEKRHWQLLAGLGAASFFEGYDINIVIVALPQIREEFHLTQAEASIWLSLLFLGALPAMIVSRRADRLGRRRLLLTTIWGYTLTTAVTALAPNIVVFALLQFLARAFLIAEVAIAWTLSNPAVTGAIVGARRPEQVDGWIEAGDVELSAEDRAEIERAVKETGAGSE